MKTLLKGIRPNDLQQVRGCRHVVAHSQVIPSFKYGAKVQQTITTMVEVACDGSCGGRK